MKQVKNLIAEAVLRNTNTPAANDCINISWAVAGCRVNNSARKCSASCTAICWTTSLLSSVTVYTHCAMNKHSYIYILSVV